MTPNSGNRSDHGELKEIIKEFLNHLDWAYHTRLQKLIFYGEVWCLQTFGKRLTDAEFLAYYHGSFSRDIETALDELRESQELEFERELKEDGPTYRYFHHEEGGEISAAKKEIIRHIHRETASWSTSKLAQFSKQTWLYENAEEEGPMDFETYRNEIVIPIDERERIADQIGNPSSDESEIKELLQ